LPLTEADVGFCIGHQEDNGTGVDVGEIAGVAEEVAVDVLVDGDIDVDSINGVGMKFEPNDCSNLQLERSRLVTHRPAIKKQISMIVRCLFFTLPFFPFITGDTTDECSKKPHNFVATHKPPNGWRLSRLAASAM
jgi:hypothetical protein